MEIALPPLILVDALRLFVTERLPPPLVSILVLCAVAQGVLPGAGMTLTAGLSAFVNNTAAVAALMPATVTLCARKGHAPLPLNLIFRILAILLIPMLRLF